MADDTPGRTEIERAQDHLSLVDRIATCVAEIMKSGASRAARPSSSWDGEGQRLILKNQFPAQGSSLDAAALLAWFFLFLS